MQKLLQDLANFVFKDLWCLLWHGGKQGQSKLEWLQRRRLGQSTSRRQQANTSAKERLESKPLLQRQHSESL